MHDRTSPLRCGTREKITAHPERREESAARHREAGRGLRWMIFTRKPAHRT